MERDGTEVKQVTQSKNRANFIPLFRLQPSCHRYKVKTHRREYLFQLFRVDWRNAMAEDRSGFGDLDYESLVAICSRLDGKSIANFQLLNSYARRAALADAPWL